MNRRNVYWVLAIVHAIFWALILADSLVELGFDKYRGFILLTSLFALIPIMTLATSSKIWFGRYWDESLKGYVGFWFVAFGYLALLGLFPGSVSVFLDNRYWGDQLLAFYGVAVFPFAAFLLEVTMHGKESENDSQPTSRPQS